MAIVNYNLAADENLTLGAGNATWDEQVNLTLGGNNTVTVDGLYMTFFVTTAPTVAQGSTVNLDNGSQLIVRSVDGVTAATPLTFNIGTGSWLNYGRDFDADALNASTINFVGSNASLRYIVSESDLHLTASPIITGLSSGNKILVEQEWTRGVGYGIAATGASFDFDTGLLTITGPGPDPAADPVVYMTFRVQDDIPEDATFTIDGQGNIVYACYLRGTLFSTPDGQRAVQDLLPGDQLCTASGGIATVKWVGFRTLHASRIPLDDAIRAFPVRITAGALAPAVPTRDLYVSPGHHMYFDGKLVAAMLLVNGKTITQDFTRQSFEYFHVELDQFDILLAEGAPAESYVDTGNRSMFQNADTVSLTTDFGPVTGRPNVAGIEVMRAGPAVLAIRKRLLRRAETLTRSTRVCDPDLRVECNDAVVRAVQGSETTGVTRFVLPSDGPISDLRIVSRSAVARDTTAHARRDLRHIGVGLARITVHDASGSREIDLNDPQLSGFHAAQDVQGVAMRWTDGEATIPATLHRITGPAVLELHVLRTYFYWDQAARLVA